MLAADTVLQGRYTVVKKLGQGGMGCVYLARDSRFHGRLVALKETLVDRERQDLRKQFEHEALLLFDLKHQALPRVIDYFGEREGEFLVMEYVEGEDLAHLLAENGGPFPVERVLEWVDQLVEALDYLHSQDPPVIHRDIKPNNVKITPKGRVVLLDFGLAKGSLDQSTRNLPGSVAAGTPFFAPLEQLNGRGTDPRSDIYSLAATIYFLLSAKLPVDAGFRAMELINGRADPLVPLPSVAPHVPPEFWEVLAAALSLAKDARPASAYQFGAALRAAMLKSSPHEGNGGGATIKVPVLTTDASADAARLTQPAPAPPTGAAASSAQPAPPFTRPAAQPTPLTAATPPPTPPPTPSHAPAEVGPGSEATRDDSDSRARTVAVGMMVVAALLLVVAAVLFYGWRSGWFRRGTAIRPEVPAEPAGRPPASPPPAGPSTPRSDTARPAAYADVVTWQVERADGTAYPAPLGPISTGDQLRFRFSAPSRAYVYLLAPDQDGAYRAFVTGRGSRATNVASNAVGPRKDLVFPGRPLSMSVRQGETRFLVVVARTPDEAPPFLRGDALVPVAQSDVEALERTAKEQEGETESTAAGNSTGVRRLEGGRGPLVFEIKIVGATGR